MPYKNKADRIENKRIWNLANKEKNKLYAKKSREKHKEQRKLDCKLWVEKNREYYLDYHKKYSHKWYQNNKESNHVRSKGWLRDNPEKAKIIKDRFLKAHPESVKAGLIKYRKTLKGKWRVLKGSAVKRNYEVTITFDDFSKIVSNPCAYCGENEKRIGIDRIDNTKGYTKENSAPCCTICNMMKKVMMVEEFLKHIAKISNYQREGTLQIRSSR